jgi:hypothetical protein
MTVLLNIDRTTGLEHALFDFNDVRSEFRSEYVPTGVRLAQAYSNRGLNSDSTA